MLKQVRWSKFAKLSFVVCVGFGVLLTARQVQTAKNKRKSKRVITKLSFDPVAEKIALFDGISKGSFKVRVLAKDSKHGKIFIENTTDQPLTVNLPASFVVVQQNLKQGGGFGGGGIGGGGIGGGGQGGGGQAAGGGGIGGGGIGGGGIGGGGIGGGQYSIPAERIVVMPYRSVCLEHGKKEPRARMKYRLVRTEDYTKDDTLIALLEIVATGKVNTKAAQAATWHLTDKMSWLQLAQKSVKHFGGVPPTPYFSRAELIVSQQLLAVAKARAEQKKKQKGKKEEQKSVRDFDTRPLRSIK